MEFRVGGTRTVVVVVVLVLGMTTTPVALAQETGDGAACDVESRELDITDAYADRDSASRGWALDRESSNQTAFDETDGTAEARLSAAAFTGLSAVGELATTTFVREWTAPCTGTFTFTATYDTDVEVTQEREARGRGNGVTKAETVSRVIVTAENESGVDPVVASEDRIDHSWMIPVLEDLFPDAVQGVVSAVVDQLFGVPVGEYFTSEVGIVRDNTSLVADETYTDQTMTVTFEATEGRTYRFAQQTETAVIAVAIFDGGARGVIETDVELTGATIAPADADESDGDDDTTSGSDDTAQPLLAGLDGATFEIRSTDEDADFEYEFVVDGDVEKSETDDVAADSSDEVIDNGDGTVTVRGSTGDASGDAYEVTGDVRSFTLSGTDDGYELLIDGDDVTENLVGDDAGDDTGASPEETLFVITALTDGEDFEYEFVVDGDVEKSETDDVAADSSDEVIDNGDGTVTVRGSTGDLSGDAYAITGEIVSFSTTADADEYSLELDGEDVTDEYD